MDRTAIIVPCFNEASRLDVDAILRLLDDRSIRLVLVDDGSTDTTRAVLKRLAVARLDRVEVLGLDVNQGKAEAVRRGLVFAIDAGHSDVVGYLDADLATPPDELHRLVDVLRAKDAQVLLGARVAILGRSINRSPVRHYLGRVFATLASLTLRLTAYDTQCGAKLFRVTPALREALRDPFISRWAFDVELLGRLTIGSASCPGVPASSIWEEPLHTWRDVGGSKLKLRHMVASLVDLGRIEHDLAVRRQLAARPVNVSKTNAISRKRRTLE
jgi:glycosyltransferase involved in cell wall biosynthesis